MALALLLAWANDPLHLSPLVPPKELATESINLSIAFGYHLDRVQIINPSQDVHRLIRLNIRHRQFWQEVNWFHYQEGYKHIDRSNEKRKSLMKIIDMLGWERFIRMEWPAPIPID